MATLSGGIIGLPNAGKSTLFNALTRSKAPVASFPFCTVSPNVGVISVPDPRLEKLASFVNPQKVTPATVEIIDVAGLIKGAHRGEGLGNEFLSRIRGIDVLIQVVRCFNSDVSHPEGEIDPARDIESINTELLLSDLNIVERRLTRLNKLLKSPAKQDKKNLQTLEVLQKVHGALKQGISPVKIIPDEEYQIIKEEGLLSLKPMIYVANVGEQSLEFPSPQTKPFRQLAHRENLETVEICAQLEMELAELPPEEKQKFIQELEVKTGALEKLTKKVYNKLNLITFFTITGGQEVRAWAIREGTGALGAAGKVHSEMKKGFVKAEVISVDKLLTQGSFKKAKSEGEVRIEGKHYQVKDGDVIHFHFAL